MFDNTPIQTLVKDQQFMVYEHPEVWQPMDTHRDYLLLNELYASQKAPWTICDKMTWLQSRCNEVAKQPDKAVLELAK